MSGTCPARSPVRRAGGSLIAQFAYALKMTFRSPSVLIWCVLFLVLMSTVFSLMFSSSSVRRIEPVATGILTNDAWERSPLARELLTQLAEGEHPTLALTYASSEDELAAATLDGTLTGYVAVGEDGLPRLTVSPLVSESTDQTVLKAAVDRVRSLAATLAGLAKTDPAAAADPATVAAFTGGQVGTRTATVLHSAAEGGERYFDVLIGMAIFQASLITCRLVCRSRSEQTEVGARRMASGTSPTLQLLTFVLAGWLATILSIGVGFAWIRWVLGVGFGGREALVVVALAVAALAASALGTLAGSLPELSFDVREAVVSGLPVVLSLGAGLFGDPSMTLADWLSVHAPALVVLNPVWQVGQALFSLRFYEELGPFWLAVGVLAGFSAVLFALSGVFMRRQRHANR